MAHHNMPPRYSGPPSYSAAATDEEEGTPTHPNGATLRLLTSNEDSGYRPLVTSSSSAHSPEEDLAGTCPPNPVKDLLEEAVALLQSTPQPSASHRETEKKTHFLLPRRELRPDSKWQQNLTNPIEYRLYSTPTIPLLLRYHSLVHLRFSMNHPIFLLPLNPLTCPPIRPAIDQALQQEVLQHGHGHHLQ